MQIRNISLAFLVRVPDIQLNHSDTIAGAILFQHYCWCGRFATTSNAAQAIHIESFFGISYSFEGHGEYFPRLITARRTIEAASRVYVYQRRSISDALE